MDERAEGGRSRRGASPTQEEPAAADSPNPLAASLEQPAAHAARGQSAVAGRRWQRREHARALRHSGQLQLRAAHARHRPGTSGQRRRRCHSNVAGQRAK